MFYGCFLWVCLMSFRPLFTMTNYKTLTRISHDCESALAHSVRLLYRIAFFTLKWEQVFGTVFYLPAGFFFYRFCRYILLTLFSWFPAPFCFLLAHKISPALHYLLFLVVPPLIGQQPSPLSPLSCNPKTLSVLLSNLWSYCRYPAVLKSMSWKK